jgi:hypothetical protein
VAACGSGEGADGDVDDGLHAGHGLRETISVTPSMLFDNAVSFGFEYVDHMPADPPGHSRYCDLRACRLDRSPPTPA